MKATPSSQFCYVNEGKIDTHLLCLKCKLPLLEPVMHMKCENLFCKECLEQQEKCPDCGEDVKDTILGMLTFLIEI